MKQPIVVGLAYGDEGKGRVVDALTRSYDAKFVIRFNGGAQAKHHVRCGDKKHGFSQFTSGTFAGATSILGPKVLVEPISLLNEYNKLIEMGITPNLFISADCPLITPGAMIKNITTEQERGNDRHGSCGFGIHVTQTKVDANRHVTIGDIFYNPIKVKQHLLEEFDTTNILDYVSMDDAAPFDLYQEIISKFELVCTSDIRDIIRNNQVVFEGAQGLLLDQRYGTMPYCTHSDTTPNNAIELLDDESDAEVYGVLRAYSTRHGAGPLPTERAPYIPEPDNPTNPFQGEFRTGYFDAVSAKQAIDIAKVDRVVITCVDLAKKHHMNQIYEYDWLELFNHNREIDPQNIVYELEDSAVIEEGDLFSNSEEGPLKEV